MDSHVHFTLAEGAMRIGVSTSTRRVWLRDGRLDLLRLGPRRVVIPGAEVEQCLARSRDGSKAAPPAACRRILEAHARLTDGLGEGQAVPVRLAIVQKWRAKTGKSPMAQHVPDAESSSAEPGESESPF